MLSFQYYIAEYFFYKKNNAAENQHQMLIFCGIITDKNSRSS